MTIEKYVVKKRASVFLGGLFAFFFIIFYCIALWKITLVLPSISLFGGFFFAVTFWLSVVGAYVTGYNISEDIL